MKVRYRYSTVNRRTSSRMTEHFKKEKEKETT